MSVKQIRLRHILDAVRAADHDKDQEEDSSDCGGCDPHQPFNLVHLPDTALDLIASKLGASCTHARTRLACRDLLAAADRQITKLTISSSTSADPALSGFHGSDLPYLAQRFPFAETLIFRDISHSGAFTRALSRVPSNAWPHVTRVEHSPDTGADHSGCITPNAAQHLARICPAVMALEGALRALPVCWKNLQVLSLKGTIPDRAALAALSHLRVLKVDCRKGGDAVLCTALPALGELHTLELVFDGGCDLRGVLRSCGGAVQELLLEAKGGAADINFQGVCLTSVKKVYLGFTSPSAPLTAGQLQGTALHTAFPRLESLELPAGSPGLTFNVLVTPPLLIAPLPHLTELTAPITGNLYSAGALAAFAPKLRALTVLGVSAFGVCCLKGHPTLERLRLCGEKEGGQRPAGHGAPLWQKGSLVVQVARGPCFEGLELKNLRCLELRGAQGYGLEFTRVGVLMQAPPGSQLGDELMERCWQLYRMVLPCGGLREFAYSGEMGALAAEAALPLMAMAFAPTLERLQLGGCELREVLPNGTSNVQLDRMFECLQGFKRLRSLRLGLRADGRGEMNAWLLRRVFDQLVEGVVQLGEALEEVVVSLPGAAVRGEVWECCEGLVERCRLLRFEMVGSGDGGSVGAALAAEPAEHQDGVVLGLNFMWVPPV